MSKKNYGKTISTKIDDDLTVEFEVILDRNGHTKQIVLRAAVLEYIKRYSDNDEFISYAKNIQFEEKH